MCLRETTTGSVVKDIKRASILALLMDEWLNATRRFRQSTVFGDRLHRPGQPHLEQ